MHHLARTPSQIGNIIHRARKKRGWTQTQLAERAGVRQATISLIESGETTGRLDTLLTVLAALDLEFRIGERFVGKEQDIEDLF